MTRDAAERLARVHADVVLAYQYIFDERPDAAVDLCARAFGEATGHRTFLDDDLVAIDLVIACSTVCDRYVRGLNAELASRCAEMVDRGIALRMRLIRTGEF